MDGQAYMTGGGGRAVKTRYDVLLQRGEERERETLQQQKGRRRRRNKICVPSAHHHRQSGIIILLYRGYALQEKNKRKTLKKIIKRKGSVCSPFRIQLLRYAHRQVYTTNTQLNPDWNITKTRQNTNTIIYEYESRNMQQNNAVSICKQ